MKNARKSHLSGIYAIEHIPSKRIYVGATHHLPLRYGQHLAELKNGKHANREMQLAYNKDGKDAFSFKLLAYTKLGIWAKEAALIRALRRMGVPLFNRNPDPRNFPAWQAARAMRAAAREQTSISRTLKAPPIRQDSHWPAILDALGLEVVIRPKKTDVQ